jgi:ABC-type glutathione transport system ATPase component
MHLHPLRRYNGRSAPKGRKESADLDGKCECNGDAKRTRKRHGGGLQRREDVCGGMFVHASRGVDVRIPCGEIVANMGPSGCGKTTLLNSLSSLDELDEDEFFAGGEPISGMSARKRALFRAQGTDFVFQICNPIPAIRDPAGLLGLSQVI